MAGVIAAGACMITSGEGRRGSFFTVVLVVACVVLAVLVVVLSRQNRQLREELAQAQQTMNDAVQRSMNALKPGQKMGAVTAVNAAGEEVRVLLDSPGRRLVMVASAACPACANAKPYWAELSGLAVAANVSTICMMADGAGNAEEEARLSMPVLGVRGFRESPLARVPSVPTVVLLRDGVVDGVWPGPFDAEGVEAIKAAMGRP